MLVLRGRNGQSWHLWYHTSCLDPLATMSSQNAINKAFIRNCIISNNTKFHNKGICATFIDFSSVFDLIDRGTVCILSHQCGALLWEAYSQVHWCLELRTSRLTSISSYNQLQLQNFASTCGWSSKLQPEKGRGKRRGIQIC